MSVILSGFFILYTKKLLRINFAQEDLDKSDGLIHS